MLPMKERNAFIIIATEDSNSKDGVRIHKELVCVDFLDPVLG